MNIDIYKHVNNYTGTLIDFYYVNQFNEAESMSSLDQINNYKSDRVRTHFYMTLLY